MLEPEDPDISALRALCEREGGYAVVAANADLNDQTLYQVLAGTLLPSGRPKGLGRVAKEKITAAYPDWRGLRPGSRQVQVQTPSSQSQTQSNVRSIEILGWVPLITSICAGEFKDSPLECAGEDPRMVPAFRRTPGPRSFALEIEGHSMTAPLGVRPSFPEGSLVLFDPDLPRERGAFVIARDGDTTTFKQLDRDGARWLLRPLNPDYKVMPIDDPDVTIVAVAIEWHGPGGRL